MSEHLAADPSANPPAPSAGALLRQARMAQGLHIAALAAQMKVSPRTLEALEADRLEQLPDTAFARALAQSVCRQLKIEPQPVLSRLPQPKSPRLEHRVDARTRHAVPRAARAAQRRRAVGADASGVSGGRR